NIKTVRRIMRMNGLALPFSKHKNSTGRRDLTKPDAPDRLWETDIHYISTARDGMVYLMSIKDCFSKRWISYELSRSCTSKDCIRAVEKAYAMRFQSYLPVRLMLRTDNGPQYAAREFSESMKLMGIGHEYIKKHTPEGNGNIESFYSSLKTDCIWVNGIETYEDARTLMEYAFIDYNTVRPHSSIEYLLPEEFERMWNKSNRFREDFLEKRKMNHGRQIRRREERKRRLNENVSLEAQKTVQN
ncbi:MAG: integrase core domain-containing protein, partial [Thermoplasmatales archaeon]